MEHGTYVHVPWCRVHCPYCGFYVSTDPRPPVERFVDRVLEEARSWQSAFPSPARSISLGGGTPSRLPVSALKRLFQGLDHAPDAELSLEANPEDVDEAWLDAMLATGVHRVSLGVQSFRAPIARRLGRGHTVEAARRATALLARSALRSWSLDLIFAVPGQTLDDLEHDLDAVVDAGAPHVSLYGLTIEPGTPFERLEANGRLREVDDSLWRAMYDLVVGRLEGAGLQRYEVSNFARPGHRSVHNEGYWEGRPYLGLGPSAHGFASDGRRWVNPRDVDAWLRGAPPDIEHPTGEDAAADLLVAGMRRVEGIDVAALGRRTGWVPDARTVSQLVTMGVLSEAGGFIALTHEGYPLADHITGRLVGALRPVGSTGAPPTG